MNKPKTISVNSAVKLLKQNKVVAFKTDTIYGFSCSALSNDAVSRLIQLKQRENKPLILLIGKNIDIKHYVKNISLKAQVLIKHFWPGPLTIIFETDYPFSKDITCGKNTIGFRMPNDELCQTLLSECDFPLVSSSANKSGERVLCCAQDIINNFEGTKLAGVIDSGICQNNSPSTIVMAVGNEIKVLREGAILTQQIDDVLNNKKQ